MHYVSVEGIGKSFGIQPLFDNISFHIEEGDKIAIIAKNGYGKTTLLKILAGLETPDAGKVWINKEVTIAFFEQEPRFIEDKSVLENIFHYEHPIINAIAAYEAACDEHDADKINTTIIKMDELGAWDFDSKVKQILGKLNIHHLSQPLQTLSGGQRKRVALARTLIDVGFELKHVLLIMDEPTNHLDVEMVEWLEHYLNHENITLLLVTHDRYFLDAVCDEIWELDRSELFTYKGDYGNYLERKAARLENESASIDKAKNTYRRELEWMRKQPRARTTKSKSRQDQFYIIEKKAKQRIDDARMQLQLKMSRLGGKVVELKKVYKSFVSKDSFGGDKIILKGFDYTFNKGDRIGVVGKNGTGKSTLLNIVQGLEKADSGKINIGDTVLFGNFSQQGLQVKQDFRLIEYVKTIAESFPLAKGGSMSAAQFLELFLFPPDKQFTYISLLSGGEKKRLQLLSILFRNPNFLILDEPTNDLDLPTLGVLENFLSEFQGCLLIVSHDRYFMDRLIDHLFVFEGNGVIKDFPGNYSQYRLWQTEQETRETFRSADSMSENKMDGKKIKEKKQLGFKEKREFELLEKEIKSLGAEKNRITEKLSSGNTSFEELQELSHRIAAITDLLDAKELRWLELSELSGNE